MTGYLQNIIKALHPLSENQDGNCPHIEWSGEDQTSSYGTGYWKCKLQPDMPCKCPDRNKCDFFRKNSVK